MPIDPEFLEILRSPDTRVPLRPAEASEIQKINQLIGAGAAVNRAGERVTEPLEEGLVPEGEAVVYPVRDDIPILLKHEAIPLDAAPAGEARD